MVPPAWYGSDLPALKQLLRQLIARRENLRRALGVFHRDRGPEFPLWKPGAKRVFAQSANP